jgi:DNA-binding GntR family transcriptional regulator
MKQPIEESRTQAASLKERVLQVLRNEIRTGALGQGVRLVESELTRRFQVSRTPLREALRQLEAEGLVVVEPHKGARVSRKSATELWEHYRIYAALHGLAAELAAPLLTAADVEKLRELQTVLEHPDAPAQGMEWISFNAQFHSVFIERAQSRAIGDLLEKQAAYLARFWPLGLHAPGVLEASHYQHRRIVELCDPPEPARLRAAVEEHFLATGRMLLEHASSVYAV